jgi:hypothetical protein
MSVLLDRLPVRHLISESSTSEHGDCPVRIFPLGDIPCQLRTFLFLTCPQRAPPVCCIHVAKRVSRHDGDRRDRRQVEAADLA